MCPKIIFCIGFVKGLVLFFFLINFDYGKIYQKKNRTP